jgi:hypothetical protein
VTYTSYHQAKQSKAKQSKEQLNAGPGSGRKKRKAGWKVYLVLTLEQGNKQTNT